MVGGGWALVLVMGVSAWVIVQGRRRPYLAAGRFWDLGMLVPVIGVVQVGGQAMADRYHYLPSVGLSIAALWGLREAMGRTIKPVGVAAVCLALAGCGAATWRQAGYWTNSTTLFNTLSNHPR